MVSSKSGWKGGHHDKNENADAHLRGPIWLTDSDATFSSVRDAFQLVSSSEEIMAFKYCYTSGA